MEALLSTEVTRLELLLCKLIPYYFLGMLAMLLCMLVSVFILGVPYRGSLVLLFHHQPVPAEHAGHGAAHLHRHPQPV